MTPLPWTKIWKEFNKWCDDWAEKHAAKCKNCGVPIGPSLFK